MFFYFFFISSFLIIFLCFCFERGFLVYIGYFLVLCRWSFFYSGCIGLNSDLEVGIVGNLEVFFLFYVIFWYVEIFLFKD